MPAMPLSAVANMLSDYVRPDFDFTKSINMVLPRIYGMGYWRDLVYQTTINTDHGYFALPEDAESLMAANVDDLPSGVQSQWADFRTVGSSNRDLGPDPIRGVVDDGYHPTIIDLDSDYKYQLVVTPDNGEPLLPDLGRVLVTYVNYDGDEKSMVFDLDGTSEMTSTERDVSQIVSITFDEVPAGVKVVSRKQGVVPTGGSFGLTIDPDQSGAVLVGLVNAGTSTTDVQNLLNAAYSGSDYVLVGEADDPSRDSLSSYVVSHTGFPAVDHGEMTIVTNALTPTTEVYVETNVDGTPPATAEVQTIWLNQVVETTLARGKGSKAVRYRRYRVSNPSGVSKNVFLLLKRRFDPLASSDDIIYIGNINALKHGLLGSIAEDNADIDRASYHWGVCKQLLEEEMDAHRGAARPTVNFDPYGGAAPTLRNIM